MLGLPNKTRLSFYHERTDCTGLGVSPSFSGGIVRRVLSLSALRIDLSIAFLVSDEMCNAHIMVFALMCVAFHVS